MITIIYSTHKGIDYNKKFKEHLIKSVGLKDVQVLEYINNNEHSLSEIYNKGISESIYNIIVCCHNDIKLESGWGKKLLDDFKKNEDFGIIGKAGSCYFPESGIYWERMFQTMVGQVYHHPSGKNKWLSKYSPKLPFIVPVVTIDGLFISFDKTKIKHFFDETIGKFHFYDHLFCIPNFLSGVKIGVTSSFEITHESVGQPNDEFYQSKTKFLEKWGTKLPLDLKPEYVYIPSIKEKNIKGAVKVAIVIPNKNKSELLFDCINSFYQHCDTNLFDIFIADTGSSFDEMDKIKSFITKKSNIFLIEYDYYNFAKINNDVVNNHVNDNYEFLLFCNNDVKILNNVINGMLKVFLENEKIGTVGARLHFEDNLIQHDGVISYLDKNKSVQVTHAGLGGYYSYSTGVSKVFGSTGALMMIRRKLFQKLNGFNENYVSCFEDVELNMACLVSGLNNFINHDCVAYHYESQTRSEDPKNLEKLRSDYINNLFPYLNKNIEKLKDKILIQN